MAVTVIQTSKISWVLVESPTPSKVSSWMEMADTMEESFIVETNWLASGGRTLRVAWGKMT